jgi:hypothetical protein
MRIRPWHLAVVLCCASGLPRPALALEQVWEQPGDKLTPEQLEQMVLDLGADAFGVRDAAARKLLARADTRVFVRLTEEQAGAADPEVRTRAAQLIPEMKKSTKEIPFIKDFQLLGPFPLTDEERALLDQPEQNDCLYVPTGLDELETIDLAAEVPLRPKQAKDSPKLKWRRPYPNQFGTLDLLIPCQENKEFAHVFLLTFIYSDKPRAATLSFGSDDGIAIWVNGKCSFYGDYHRAMTPDTDQITVDLKKGWNPVMLRIAQGYGLWAVALRVTDHRGRPWPAKCIDPLCNGEPLPPIPAPKQPGEKEKALLIPEALRKSDAAAQPAGAAVQVQVQGAAIQINAVQINNGAAPVPVRVQVLQVNK